MRAEQTRAAHKILCAAQILRVGTRRVRHSKCHPRHFFTFECPPDILGAPQSLHRHNACRPALRHGRVRETTQTKKPGIIRYRASESGGYLFVLCSRLSLRLGSLRALRSECHPRHSFTGTTRQYTSVPSVLHCNVERYRHFKSPRYLAITRA